VTSPGTEVRGRFELGDWTVEPTLDRIWRDDHIVLLRPRAMEVLVCLADLRGQLATKQHLIDTVWHTEFVSENALTHVIAELRTALGDDAQHPRYIETIPRRGYRLVAQVTHHGRAPVPAPAPPPRFKLASDDDEFPLGEGENLIGRGPDAKVRVDDPEVSRRHATITVEGDVAILQDLGSKNGTFLRGERVVEPARLANADEIRIGINVATFRFVAIDDPTKTEQT
jgi:DNA-binding winged helix-turn-helix (wHTH) protein